MRFAKASGVEDLPPKRGLHSVVKAEDALMFDYAADNIHRTSVRAGFILQPVKHHFRILRATCMFRFSKLT